ncbi:NUDIX domain-containing protein [Pseudoalteromonas sp. GB56]
MNKINSFKSNDVEIESKQRVFQGFFKIDLYRFNHALFAGGRSQTIQREILERGHAVAVLPYDPKTRHIVLIEQIRIGALASKDNPWLLECIAGMADGSEDYPDVVRKEAKEEAGLELGELEFMLSYLSSPGGTTERLYLYLAQTDLSNTDVGGVYGLDEEGEDIKVHVMDLDEALDRLASGEIDNAATVISLQWLALNEQRLQQQWNKE